MAEGKLKSSIVLILIAGAIIGMTGAFFALREPMSDLTIERIDAARRAWKTLGVRDYDTVYDIAGGIVEARVRADRVVSLTRDGLKATSHRLDDFTVEGMFDTLEREIELANDPSQPFGGGAQTTLLRVRFNRECGYMERYLRAVGGTGRSQTMQLIEFRRTSPSEPDQTTE